MAITVHRISPVARLPLLSRGRGGEVLILAMLDGHDAFYKVGCRLRSVGCSPCSRQACNAYRCVMTT